MTYLRRWGPLGGPLLLVAAVAAGLTSLVLPAGDAVNPIALEGTTYFLLLVPAVVPLVGTTIVNPVFWLEEASPRALRRRIEFYGCVLLITCGSLLPVLARLSDEPAICRALLRNAVGFTAIAVISRALAGPSLGWAPLVVLLLFVTVAGNREPALPHGWALPIRLDASPAEWVALGLAIVALLAVLRPWGIPRWRHPE